MDINIKPALQIEERKNLSAEEFQKQLCSWLESRGLLRELRAYFRSNMIEVLKNTALGSTISCNFKQPISPKMQAMNLLISEYFIYSQYHFSLCVFCTEVSLNHMLSDISGASVITKSEGRFKFSEKEVYDILEAVGLLRYNKQARKIYAAYCETDNPLISYFLPSSSLTSLASNEELVYVETEGHVDVDLVINNIDKIIDNSNMHPSEVSELKYYIKLLSTKQSEKQMKLFETLKEQYRNQLKKYRSKLHNIQQSFEEERKKFQEEINVMNEELTSVLLHNKALRNEKTFDIPEVANLIQELQTIEAPTSKLSIINHVQVEDKAVQWVEDKPPKKCNQEQQTIANASLESAVLKHVVEQLEKENISLRNDNFNYCEQIDELANRASILMNELNISQQNIIRLNNLLQNTPTTFTQSQRRQTLHYTGAGEECSGAFQEQAKSNYRHLCKERNRKLSTKKMLYSPGTSSSSTSPTDEVLREAKKKLKSLEIESENIDRKMQNVTERFHSFTNQAQNKPEHKRNFKFNTAPSDTTLNRIFEFGASVIAVPSTDTECTTVESETTTAASTSQCDGSQSKDDD